MVRPSLKEVREVDEPVERNIQVYDLNHDGISEVVAQSIGSGQGTTSGVKAIVQFDGWTPVVLHQAEFEQGCGMDFRCFSETVSWKFLDLDNDGNTDLVEEITTSPLSPANKSARTSKVRHRFLFIGDRFTKYEGATRATKNQQIGKY